MSMRDLWRPITELADRYAPNLLLRAPELVDLDCNPHGVGPGYWQDDADGIKLEKGAWLCAKWSMTSDEWYEVACQPTHYLVIEGPIKEEEDGVDPFESADLLRPRGNGGVVSADICLNALLLTGAGEAIESEIAEWTQAQRDAAYDWAMRVHLSASDNEGVIVPKRPEHVRLLRR
jgi:hypothetical protein